MMVQATSISLVCKPIDLEFLSMLPRKTTRLLRVSTIPRVLLCILSSELIGPFHLFRLLPRQRSKCHSFSENVSLFLWRCACQRQCNLECLLQILTPQSCRPLNFCLKLLFGVETHLQNKEAKQIYCFNDRKALHVKLLIGKGDWIYSNISDFLQLFSFLAIVKFETILWQYWDLFSYKALHSKGRVHFPENSL